MTCRAHSEILDKEEYRGAFMRRTALKCAWIASRRLPNDQPSNWIEF